MATPAANPTSSARPRLGEILLREGRVSAEQLQRALNEQSAYGGRLGRHLLDLGYINESMLLDALSRQLRIPMVDLDAVGVVATDAARYGRADQCEQWGFVPLQYDQRANRLVVAVADPDPQLLADIEGFVGMRVDLRISPADKIDRTIRRLFHGEGSRIETKQLAGLQVARSAARNNNRDDGLGAAGGGGPAQQPQQLPPPTQASAPMAPPMAPQPMGAGPGLDYNAQIAQQLNMQQQMQAQLQQQIQMQQYQLQAAAQAAQAAQAQQLQAQQLQVYAAPPMMQAAPQPQPQIAYAPQPQPPTPASAVPANRPSERPGFDSLIEAIPDGTPAPASLTTPPERSPSMVERSAAEHRSRRAGPAIDVEAPRNDAPSLEALAEQVSRLEKTLTAQARALRSLVEVLVDRGLISKAEMARKQQGK